MEKRLLGVIDATAFHEGLQELTLHRSPAAIPFGGRYRLIDFVLSNMVNSGIQSVAIFPKYQYRSLMDHLGSGRNWDLNRKRDGLFFFPSPRLDHPVTGVGPLDHFAANIDFFKRSEQEYTLITNACTIFNTHFFPVLEWHIASGCDITAIRKGGVSLGMYLLKTSLLRELIETRHETGYLSVRDAATDPNSPLSLCSYPYEGYAAMIDSVDTYFSASMDLFEPEVWNQLFPRERPILTKVKDEPPTRYAREAYVHNTMVANGGLIEGTVENSIIARGVKIGKGAVVRNCIIMQKSKIEENCIVEGAILDKDVKVERGAHIKASGKKPYVVRKGTVQGAWMNS
ncbi:sugar phosphate nucleotidyltransferase [Mesobacillus zeae]|uniref:Glucose-1-phosphate adenylyltransferase n=1 Tax=Mesobacillus zeae TaxID=1917180 RepID=A0A398AZI8_9BACI|nr:sugar phosphate nucleotidyltransferase [Mesobacillus zeae]RID83017.1 glucose-1-phosphate adenylyltransferase [Mesobacillus zeae]